MLVSLLLFSKLSCCCSVWKFSAIVAVIELWQLFSLVVSLWFHCGFTVVSLWFHCGFTVVSLVVSLWFHLWFHCGFTVVSLVVSLWFHCGFTVVSLWFHCGFTCGFTVVSLVVSLCFLIYFVLLLLYYVWDSVWTQHMCEYFAKLLCIIWIFVNNVLSNSSVLCTKIIPLCCINSILLHINILRLTGSVWMCMFCVNSNKY